MVVLAIDSSHPEGSVCVASGSKPLKTARFGRDSSHLVEIGRRVDGLLAARGLMPSDISRVALVSGPGSFTGLRIGMSFAKGLVAALDVDLVTVGTLELLAMPLLFPDPPSAGVAGRLGDEAVAVMVDARKSEVYAAVFRRAVGTSPAGPPRLEALVAPCAESPERFVNRARQFAPLYVGSGAQRYRETVVKLVGAGGRFAPEAASLPSTQYLAGIAGELTPLDHEAVLSLEPRYIRASDAILKPLKPVNPHDDHD